MSESETVKVQVEFSGDVRDDTEKICAREDVGTYNDWLLLSVLRGLLDKQAYAQAFKFFIRSEFSENQIDKKAYDMVLEALEEIEV